MTVLVSSAPQLEAAVGTSTVTAAALTAVRVLIAAAVLEFAVRSEMTGFRGKWPKSKGASA